MLANNALLRVARPSRYIRDGTDPSRPTCAPDGQTARTTEQIALQTSMLPKPSSAGSAGSSGAGAGSSSAAAAAAAAASVPAAASAAGCSSSGSATLLASAGGESSSSLGVCGGSALAAAAGSSGTAAAAGGGAGDAAVLPADAAAGDGPQLDSLSTIDRAMRFQSSSGAARPV